MKTTLIKVALILFTTFGLNAANGFSQTNSTDVDLLIKNQIEAKYKGAVILETEKENGKIEVEIISNQKKKTLIFSNEAVWQSTKYDVLKSELPEKIKEVIKNSKYSSYKIDEVEVIEKPDRNLYKIDLDKFLSDDVTIYIDFDGKII